MNPRPLGYEPNELPDCSTPRSYAKGILRTCQVGVVKDSRSQVFHLAYALSRLRTCLIHILHTAEANTILGVGCIAAATVEAHGSPFHVIGTATDRDVIGSKGLVPTTSIVLRMPISEELELLASQRSPQEYL